MTAMALGGTVTVLRPAPAFVRTVLSISMPLQRRIGVRRVHRSPVPLQLFG